VIPRQSYQGFFCSRSGLISNTFMIDKMVLEKILEFVPGEWLLSSYLATGMANVPILMKADNAEDEVERYLMQCTIDRYVN
jgi:hypothetical protein